MSEEIIPDAYFTEGIDSIVSPCEQTLIGRAVRKAERERGDKMRELIAEYDSTVHYPLLKKLQEQCGALGHQWQITGWTTLNGVEYRCIYCHAREVRDR